MGGRTNTALPVGLANNIYVYIYIYIYMYVYIHIMTDVCGKCMRRLWVREDDACMHLSIQVSWGFGSVSSHWGDSLLFYQ